MEFGYGAHVITAKARFSTLNHSPWQKTGRGFERVELNTT